MGNYFKFIFILLILGLLILGINKYYPENKDVLWKFKLKGDVYTAQFYDDSKIIVTGTMGFGLKCLDIEKGKVHWSEDKDKIVSTLNKPFIYNGCLFTGTDRSNCIYRIDISTGEYLEIYEIDGIAILTGISDEQLYFIARAKDYSSYKLQVLDFDTGNVSTIYEFQDKLIHVRDPLIFYKDYILVSTLQKNDRNFLYSINRKNGNLIWKIELPVTGMRMSNVIYDEEDSIYWVDRDKNLLYEKNLETGFTDSIQLEDITSFCLKFDGEHILIYGKMEEIGTPNMYYSGLYLYNVNDRYIRTIHINYNNALVNGDKIIYEYRNKIFIYYLETGESREIYSFKEELVDMFATEKYLLLMLARDVVKAHVGYEPYKYVLLSL